MEIIEHKGYGHPDSLTDAIVEKCSEFLDNYYLVTYGQILHYNVDKALLLAGNAQVTFKEVKVLSYPTFILGGQISQLNNELRDLLKEVIFSEIKRLLPNLLTLDIEIRSSENNSISLNGINNSNEILANDTSFGVGYYPLSDSEQLVLNLKNYIEVLIKSNKYPLGEDFKIMYTDEGIYVSAPLYVTKVVDFAHYLRIKKDIENDLAKYGKVTLNPDLNEDYPYLTLFGSSIESGDDGQVGRGNRFNGLITPGRPMTLEAFHGKNNKNHVGKIYQKLASETARIIYNETGKYTEVYIVSKIGKRVDDYELYIKQ